MSTGSIVALVLIVGLAILGAFGIHLAAEFMRRRRAAARLDRCIGKLPLGGSVTRMGPRP